MAITSGYFNSVNGDRKYNADQMSEYFEGIINEGVCQHIDGGLAVTAGTGLSVNVAAGKAFIGKKWIRNDTSLTLTISAASASYARIDAVVLRRNNTTRTCQIVVKSGTPAASPAAPTMTRNSTTYEMALAYVNVAANATSVTVTDKRADTTVCGWATVAESVPGEIDAQLNAMKTGFDGVVYSSPAAMVQGEDQKFNNNIEFVNNNLSKISEATDGIVSIFPFNFELGNITINGGVPSYPSSTSKVRTKADRQFYFKKNTVLYFDDFSTYDLYLIKYASSVSSTQITVNAYPITAEGSYGFVISKKAGTEITNINDVIALLRFSLPASDKAIWSYFEADMANKKYTFDVGSVAGTGDFSTTNTRCRSGLIRVKKGAIISIDYNLSYDISTAYYADDMSLISATNWNKVLVVPETCYVVIIGRRSDNAAISASDITNIQNTLRIIQNPINDYWNRFPKQYGIAHSGGNFGPRNTVPAYIGAFNAGFKYVETDVTTTADGVYVCIHGDTINQYGRNPDGSEIEETLYVKDLTYEQLLYYDFGIYYGSQYAGTKIATLKEVAEICHKLQMHLFVDIKDYVTFTQTNIGEIMDVVKAAGMFGDATFCCETLDYAESVYKIDNTANISCIFSGSQWYRVLRFYSGKNAVSLNSTYSTVTSAIISNCESYGIPLITGMLNSSADIEAMPQYISGIVSDSICVEKYWHDKYIES